MGIFTSKKKETCIEGEEVTFDHFQVLRAIGRGSFGKVCIVQKKSNKQMYAMKYMNKSQCEAKEALQNVFREIEILASLSHPFLVNLWFSFQDAEDMFVVVELLLGGDLRYHLHQGVLFGDEAVRLFILEAGSALAYLHANHIIHRDIKPDNLLLDEEGHVHITDFNIAAVVRSGQMATSMSGTKPYMAPEVFECAADTCPGYGSAVDWWSLGVCGYELRRGRRPFDIHAATTLTDIRALFTCPPRFPADCDPGLVQLISRLLIVEPCRRLTSMEDILRIPFMSMVKMQDVLNKKIQPPFTPPRDHLNCDPTFELEEMIIESRPLHKKKKRLSKQKSLTHTSSHSATTELEEERYGAMLVFNREVMEAKKEKERKRKEEEETEKNWQHELEESMRLSDPTGQGCSFTGSHCNTPVKNTVKQQQQQQQHDLPPPPPPPAVTLTPDDPKHVTKTSVSPSSVRARIARSPKVKVRGTTVTIESPRSSSSSLTKTNTANYLQERLKELQAEQNVNKPGSEESDVTHTDDVTPRGSQSEYGAEQQPANHGAAIKTRQPESSSQNCLGSHVAESSIGKGAEEEEEEEEEEGRGTTTTTTTVSSSKNHSNSNDLNKDTNTRQKRTNGEKKR